MVAAQSVGAVPVPVYQDSSAEEMAYVLDHCGAAYVIAGDQEQVDKVIEVKDQLTNLKHMIYVDPKGLRKYDHHQLHQYSHVQEQGRAARDEFSDDLAARKAKLTYNSICVMLYTWAPPGGPRAWCSPIAMLSRAPRT